MVQCSFNGSFMKCVNRLFNRGLAYTHLKSDTFTRPSIFNCPCSLFHYSSISFHRFSQFPFQSNTFDTNAVNDDDFYYYRSAPFHQFDYKWLFGVIFQNDVGWCMYVLWMLLVRTMLIAQAQCVYLINFNVYKCNHSNEMFPLLHEFSCKQ